MLIFPFTSAVNAYYSIGNSEFPKWLAVITFNSKGTGAVGGRKKSYCLHLPPIDA